MGVGAAVIRVLGPFPILFFFLLALFLLTYFLPALKFAGTKALFLIPGYGAQGGKASDLKDYFNKDGLGALVSASRSIIFAYKDNAKKEWRKDIKDAIRLMRDEINEVIWD